MRVEQLMKWKERRLVKSKHARRWRICIFIYVFECAEAYHMQTNSSRTYSNNAIE